MGRKHGGTFNWYVGSRCYVLVLYWFLAYLSDRRLWQLAVVQALLSAADWLPDELSLGRPLLKSSRLPAFLTLSITVRVVMRNGAQ